MNTFIKTSRKIILMILTLIFAYIMYKTSSSLLFIINKGIKLNDFDGFSLFNFLKGIAIAVLYIVFLINQIPLIFINKYNKKKFAIVACFIFILSILYNYGCIYVLMVLYQSPSLLEGFSGFHFVLDIIEVVLLIFYIVVSIKDNEKNILAQ